MDINRKIFAAQQDTAKKDKLLLIPQHILVEHGLSDDASTLLTSLFPSKQKGHVVCDTNTYAALGEKISAQTELPTLTLPTPTKASIENVERIEQQTKDADFLIAVGSGTINDLCKYASFRANKPYIVFGTAASMNGYLSANASISDTHGAKNTLAAHLPHAAFFDLDVISNAPARLTLAGFGDSICRATAQFDWLLSYLLLNTAYDASLFAMLRESEATLIANTHQLQEGKSTAMEALMENLLLSGVGMFLAGGSYPASQGEHLLAHYIDTHYKHDTESYHGEHIAVTTPVMAKIQQLVLTQEHIQYSSKIIDRENFLPHFSADIQDYYYAQYRKKMIDEDMLLHLNHQLHLHWKDIRSQLEKVILPDHQIEHYLQQAGCPTEAEHIGWKKKWLHSAISHAHLTRDRFTALDLANGAILTPTALL